MDLDIQAYGELKEYFRNFDPRHEREKAIFTKLGYIDIQYLAPRIKAKTLLFTGLMDNVCPPSSQYAAYNKMNCPKKHILYPDFGHECLYVLGRHSDSGMCNSHGFALRLRLKQKP